MWLTNLKLYRFNQPVPFTLEELTAGLNNRPARPCGSQEKMTLGWARPFGKHSSDLIEPVAGYWLVCLEADERILPSAVINKALKEKIAAIEQRDDRKVYKKERDTLKDELVMDMLPRAFTRTKQAKAIIGKDWIAIDTPSTARAEDLLNMLREATGTLPVRPLNVRARPDMCMTDWLRQAPPEGFVIGDSCALVDPSEASAAITFKHQDLRSDEVQQHLHAGNLVQKLDVQWRDNLSFTLNSNLTISRMRFDDVYRDKADEDGGEDIAGRMQATLAIVGGTIDQLIDSLADAFGGEEAPVGL